MKNARINADVEWEEIYYVDNRKQFWPFATTAYPGGNEHIFCARNLNWSLLNMIGRVTTDLSK
jgi:hypothetical protein